MKTPIQEFYKFMEQNRYFIGNDLFAKYKELLEKEKEVICEFASDFANECINFHHERTMSSEEYFNQTFNTKEK